MAFGKDFFGGGAGAVSDLFAASGARSRAQGNRLEAQSYGLASNLALQNAEFSTQSTAVKRLQAERDIYRGIGTTAAGVAGAGLAESGSALDLLAAGAQQGALTQQVLGQQGLIEEAGFEQQAASYKLMQQAANIAADAQMDAASGLEITAAIRGVTAIASLFTGGGSDAAGPILSGNEAVLGGFGG